MTEGSLPSERETGGLFPFERTCQITQTCFQPLFSKVATDGGRSASWAGWSWRSAAAVFPVCAGVYQHTQVAQESIIQCTDLIQPYSNRDACPGVCCLSQIFFYFPVLNTDHGLPMQQLLHNLSLQDFGTKCSEWLDDWESKLWPRWVLVEINVSWRFILAAVRWTKRVFESSGAMLTESAEVFSWTMNPISFITHVHTSVHFDTWFRFSFNLIL